MRMKMSEGGRPRMTSGSSIAEDAVDQLQASEKLIAGKIFPLYPLFIIFKKFYTLLLDSHLNTTFQN